VATRDAGELDYSLPGETTGEAETRLVYRKSSASLWFVVVR
jgi:hypothetical protein